MILVVKDSRVIAYHDDNQESVIKDKYPECELVKADSKVIQFDEEGWPLVPRDGVKLAVIGTVEQRLADLEAAVAALLGGGT